MPEGANRATIGARFPEKGGRTPPEPPFPVRHKDDFRVGRLSAGCPQGRAITRPYLDSTVTSTLAPCVMVLKTGEYSVSLLRRSMLSVSALTLNLTRIFV